MHVKLRNNSFTATQWNKPGDHPSVNSGICDGNQLYHIWSVDSNPNDYNYGESITFGTWIVEMFDGIHLFSDEEFKKLFELSELSPYPPVCIGCSGDIMVPCDRAYRRLHEGEEGVSQTGYPYLGYCMGTPELMMKRLTELGLPTR